MDKTDTPLRDSLGPDTALVLFEFLSREIDARDGARVAPSFDYPAEYWALNDVLNQLERELAEPFDPAWQELLKRARAGVLHARTVAP